MKRVIMAILIITISNLAYAAPLETGVIDDDHPALRYLGNWTYGENARAVGDAYQLTDSQAASIAFDTRATGLTIVFFYDPLGDSVEICIDDECSTVSTNGAVSRGYVEFTDLSDSLKTVTLTKFTADSSLFIFDAIYNHPEEVSQTEITQEFDFNGESYQGIQELRVTSGDMAITNWLMVISLLLVFLLVTNIWIMR